MGDASRCRMNPVEKFKARLLEVAGCYEYAEHAVAAMERAPVPPEVAELVGAARAMEKCLMDLAPWTPDVAEGVLAIVGVAHAALAKWEVAMGDNNDPEPLRNSGDALNEVEKARAVLEEMRAADIQQAKRRMAAIEMLERVSGWLLQVKGV